MKKFTKSQKHDKITIQLLSELIKNFTFCLTYPKFIYERRKNY